MSSLDLFEDGFPHGTKEGFEKGCKGSHCPGAIEWGIACREASMRYAGDRQYKKRVDAGASPAEIAAFDAADADEGRLKSKALDRKASQPNNSIQSSVTVADSFEPLPVDEADAPEAETEQVVEVPKPKRQYIRRAIDPVTGEKIVAPENHGTDLGYKHGCRAMDCPGIKSKGVSCKQAHATYMADWARNRKAEKAAEAEGVYAVSLDADEQVDVVVATVEPVELEVPDQSFEETSGDVEYSADQLRTQLDESSSLSRVKGPDVVGLLADLQEAKGEADKLALEVVDLFGQVDNLARQNARLREERVTTALANDVALEKARNGTTVSPSMSISTSGDYLTITVDGALFSTSELLDLIVSTSKNWKQAS